ncbi:MAG: double-strand break repair protein AddB [Hyphomicrobiaceae bacterium]
MQLIFDLLGGAKPAGRRPQIFTVPPEQPFLTALAQAILRGDLPKPGGAAPEPLDLPQYTILLPTRRAARALQEAFLKAGGGKAMLLPRITPIAEGQEDLGLLEGAISPLDLGDAADTLLPAVGELERRLVLTRLVMAWADKQRAEQPTVTAPTPAQAVRLATDLARLMDAVETESADFSGLRDLVPDTFSEHWQKTLDFLTVVTEAWPAYLSNRGLASPMTRRNQLVRMEAARFAAHPPAHPVIVAGVTGSVPATAELMRAVAATPSGAIVLPALDPHLDDETWAALADDPGHPQSGFRTLLDQLQVQRRQVTMLPGCAVAPMPAMRSTIVAEALRPASSISHWRVFATNTDKAALAGALADVELIEASGTQDEAEAVALILREALETPGRTAALVSPDRLLARRVAIRLQSWGVRVDDSAGRPFAKTVPGTFLDLVADAVTSHFQPAELMALLKHPLTRLGLPPGQLRRTARMLEIAAFRTLYLDRGLAGVEAALERAAREVAGGARRQRAVRRLWDADWAAARDLVQRLKTAMAPLTDVFSAPGQMPLGTLAAAHIAAAEALAQPPDAEAEGSPLWQGEAGEAAARLFAGLLDQDLLAPHITAADYADFYRSLIAGESVRPRVPVHPRLFIWGPFEARLQQTDVMVLGSLNEGTWPAPADPGAWLNRPMRQAMGLPAPEIEIGRAAHDFTTFLGAGKVVLTRARKVDGAPTVPSRWLMRLKALLEGVGQADALATRAPWLAWARARNDVVRRPPLRAPEPRPPVALRPRGASVSDVETWVRNPYEIFARRVLALEQLPELGAEPGPQEKGQIVHEALSRFAARFPQQLPPDVCKAFLDIAAEVLHDLSAHPRVAAFWMPRLARFAEWFAQTEADRRDGVTRLVAEVAGAQVLSGPAGPFTLRARADRLDVTRGGVVITDYKTGALPSDTAVVSGYAPQLPLEAAILAAGGFGHVPETSVAALRYIRATGAEPPGAERIVKTDDVTALAANSLAGLQRLIARFDDESTPYRAVRRFRFNYDYDDYAHLARVAEWTSDSTEEDDAWPSP